MLLPPPPSFHHRCPVRMVGMHLGHPRLQARNLMATSQWPINGGTLHGRMRRGIHLMLWHHPHCHRLLQAVRHTVVCPVVQMHAWAVTSRHTGSTMPRITHQACRHLRLAPVHVLAIAVEAVITVLGPVVAIAGHLLGVIAMMGMNVRKILLLRAETRPTNAPQHRSYMKSSPLTVIIMTSMTSMG